MARIEAGKLYLLKNLPIRDVRFHMQLGKKYVVAIPASFECANPDVVYVKRKSDDESYAYCVIEACICRDSGYGGLSHCFLAISDEAAMAARAYKTENDTSLSDMILLLAGFEGDKRADGCIFRKYVSNEVNADMLRSKGVTFNKEKLIERLSEQFNIITKEEYLCTIREEES